MNARASADTDTNTEQRPGTCCHRAPERQQVCRPDQPPFGVLIWSEAPARLNRFGQHLIHITQRRQAGRARLGRMLDASWSASKTEADPTRSGQ